MTPVLAGCALDAERPSASPRVVEPRQQVLLDAQPWQFIQDDALGDTAALAADGASWATVHLPHTWNAADAASIAATTPDTPEYRRGVGWYRLDFVAPARGGSHWLQFDGASIVADVWLNGVKLGRHRGAFTAFRVDVTRPLRRGRNVLLVKTDNSAPRTGTDPTAIIPLSGDFNLSGGLYRSVALISTAAATHIALDDFGSSGIRARTLSIKDGNAVVGVRTLLDNDAETPVRVAVSAQLLDAHGHVVAASHSATFAVAARSRATSEQVLRVADARLWRGITDPYLYTLVVEVRDEAGVRLDQVTQDFGIRTMHFDADRGFFLNGESMPLRGVNLHQDYLGKAWAISAADTDESLALIREIGANAIRLAHYPHAPYTLQQADRLGFVVWAELPYVNQALLDGECGRPVARGLIDNARQQLRELIGQQFNHASIALWSVGNEIATGDLKCAGEHGRIVDTSTPLLRELHALAKQEDPTRVTTMADHAEQRLATGGITDTWALNRYYLWYQDRGVERFGAELDELHRKYPHLPIGISEYGAGAALGHQTDHPLGGLPTSFDHSNKTRTGYQPEGCAGYVHEQNYAVLASRPYLWGSFVWNMFDFGSGRRHEGDVGGTNTKGLVSFDRKTRKDPFYFYQANWRREPVTHLVGKRYVERAYRFADVKVYSNADAVTLRVNEAEVGTRRAEQCPWRVCDFRQVPLAVGDNQVVVEGRHGSDVVRDGATWHLDEDNARNVYIAAGQITTGFVSSTGHRYGSDQFFEGGTTDVLYPVGWIGSQDKTPLDGVLEADLPLWSNVRMSIGSLPFAYDIPLPNGRYRVRLGFLEPDRSMVVGARVFAVEANGRPVIRRLDVLKAAAGARRAITRTFEVDVQGGRLRLDFKPIVGGAVVSNLSIVRE